MLNDHRTIVLLLPEIVLAIMAAWIYIGGTMTRSRTWWATFASVTYGVAGIVMWRTEGLLWRSLLSNGWEPSSGPLAIDLLGHLVRWIALLAGFLLTLIAAGRARRELSGEHFGTLMLIVLGIMLTARANELVFLFVSLELISIPTYVLLYLGRRDRLSAEAAAKYFYLSILSSALLLYGLSFLYGVGGTSLLAGTGEEPGIREILATTPPGTATLGGALVPLGFILVLAGLGFRLAAVPFHFYAPDVYQGANSANAALLAAAPKIAGVVALVRIISVMAPAFPSAWQITMVVAMLTMTIGNVSALCQNNIRRLLAFSSIAHAGYMLIGLTVALAADPAGLPAFSGVGGTLVYLYVYVLAVLGVFAALTFLGGRGVEMEDVDQLAGLGRSRPVVATAIAICMFSLAGLPPLAGFWGKLALLSDAVRMAYGTSQSQHSLWFIVLAMVGVVNAAIAAGYYLRIVAVMYFYPPRGEMRAEGGLGPWLAMAVSVVLLVSVGLTPGRSLDQTRRAQNALARSWAAGSSVQRSPEGAGGERMELSGPTSGL